jgi:hypothetical protein
VALRRGDVLAGQGQGLVELVEHDQQVAAPLLDEVSAALVADRHVGSQRTLGHVQRRCEAVLGVVETGLGYLEDEPAAGVAGVGDLVAHEDAHLTCLSGSPGDDEVVKQQGVVAASECG